ncbi:hypothetical protein AZ78_4445 [Lysobacter capsici AZ78]|uniref:Uncharacterized protein n=1 Tax=Lysobacter capsici AZ78 TaxID=1444315 RepID=A0A108UDJ5_9GAMM|nr:hypothetical protein AZ78_4445 [Lysobacter capsici AZ78]
MRRWTPGVATFSFVGKASVATLLSPIPGGFNSEERHDPNQTRCG